MTKSRSQQLSTGAPKLHGWRDGDPFTCYTTAITKVMPHYDFLGDFDFNSPPENGAAGCADPECSLGAIAERVGPGALVLLPHRPPAGGSDKIRCSGSPLENCIRETVLPIYFDRWAREEIVLSKRVAAHLPDLFKTRAMRKFQLKESALAKEKSGYGARYVAISNPNRTMPISFIIANSGKAVRPSSVPSVLAVQ